MSSERPHRFSVLADPLLEDSVRDRALTRDTPPEGMRAVGEKFRSQAQLIVDTAQAVGEVRSDVKRIKELTEDIPAIRKDVSEIKGMLGIRFAIYTVTGCAVALVLIAAYAAFFRRSEAAPQTRNGHAANEQRDHREDDDFFPHGRPPLSIDGRGLVDRLCGSSQPETDFQAEPSYYTARFADSAGVVR